MSISITTIHRNLDESECQDYRLDLEPVGLHARERTSEEDLATHVGNGAFFSKLFFGHRCLDGFRIRVPMINLDSSVYGAIVVIWLIIISMLTLFGFRCSTMYVP